MAAPVASPAWLLPPRATVETKAAGVLEEDMSYDERLFHYAYATRSDDVHFVEYRILRRINIFRLQNELARLKGLCWADNKAGEQEWEQLKDTLHDYTTAIKDYAYVRSLRSLEDSQSSARQRDLAQAFPEIAELSGSPFNSRYCSLDPLVPVIPSDSLRSRLKRILPRRLTYTKTEMDARMDDFLQNKPPNNVSPFVDKLARFIIAFTGGASLIVPMLIMSLPSTSQVKSLITVSVAVILFAIVLSVVVRAGNSETLVSTATYAAVLVVFVGTSATS